MIQKRGTQRGVGVRMFWQQNPWETVKPASLLELYSTMKDETRPGSSSWHKMSTVTAILESVPGTHVAASGTSPHTALGTMYWGDYRDLTAQGQKMSLTRYIISPGHTQSNGGTGKMRWDNRQVSCDSGAQLFTLPIITIIIISPQDPVIFSY